ncbi:hypothetical protein GDO78_011919 [Eleutherodactylus coqui]|uniref:Uncharacterized protein n=1 Tax=Eleutherodactylus coqui TaxID=57060 RepID=A0A8J6K683_ELECQ|nr:hypothetical protein GDO78_011919 [Eleutherodactylus coqui]
MRFYIRDVEGLNFLHRNYIRILTFHLDINSRLFLHLEILDFHHGAFSSEHSVHMKSLGLRGDKSEDFSLKHQTFTQNSM